MSKKELKLNNNDITESIITCVGKKCYQPKNTNAYTHTHT